ncbi:MAG: hypothetical protein GX410_07295 [Elusimicrobia bacterium]|nr:hypothetical protein [Elusimicrobiota bacterium]
MNTDLKALCAQLDSFKTRLSALSAALAGLGARAGAISRQLKRNRTVRDDSFESDFNALLEQLKPFLSEFETAAKDLSEASRSRDGLPEDADSSLLKNMVFHARNASLETDKFSSAFREAHREGKNLQLKLNWWMVEAYSSDLEHLVGKLLFAARELAKAADARAEAQQRLRHQPDA